MKHLILFFTCVFLSANAFSQSIADFFQEIPDSSILNLSKKERMEIVKQSSDNKTQEDAGNDLKKNKILYAFSAYDPKNGYLKLIGAFEGHLQMCYWNLKNGTKLIAVYQEACGPACYVEQFDFYIYNGKDYKAVPSKKVIPEIIPDFFKNNSEENLKKMTNDDVIAGLLFELPRSGKNIIAKWGNEDSPETYKKYGVIGDRMKLQWNDGTFLKGPVYWNK